MDNYFSKFIDEVSTYHRQTIASCDGQEVSTDAALQRWVEETFRVYTESRQIFMAGNGASCTMAEHFGLDAMKNGRLKTVNFSETSYITAVSNDISYEDVFMVKLQRLGTPGDMLITISSSGNSPNIVKALEYSKANGITCVTLSAMKPDNKSRQLGDINFYVPAPTYGLAESIHSSIMHCWLDCYLDKHQGGRH